MMSRRLKRILGWEEIVRNVDDIVARIPADTYDLLLVVTRGGMVPACLVSERVDLRNIMVAAVQFRTGVGEELERPVFWQFPEDRLLEGKSVLIVDDVWRSGRTALHVRDRVREVADRADVAVLHFKPASSQFPDEQPDFYGEMTDDWIVYPWDSERGDGGQLDDT